MPPKKPTETAPDQGALFQEVVSTRYPTTDLDDAIETVNYDVGEGNGVFPEPNIEDVESEPTPEQLDLTLAVHEAAKTQNRRLGQLGKHTALNPETGLHDADSVRPGTVLPGFGIVRYRNLEEAKAFAKKLAVKAQTKRLNEDR